MDNSNEHDGGTDLPKFEYGVAEARKHFKFLLDRVEQETDIIHLARDGKRIASLARPERVARCTPLQVPGTHDRAIELVIAWQAADAGRSFEISPRRMQEVSAEELAGGAATMLWFLFEALSAQQGMIVVQGEDGQPAPHAPAVQFVILKLIHLVDLPRAAIPPVAGALWAMHLGDDPANWRNRIGSPLEPGEAQVWLAALWAFCNVLDFIFGAGFAEQHMFGIDELLRHRSPKPRSPIRDSGAPLLS